MIISHTYRRASVRVRACMHACAHTCIAYVRACDAPRDSHAAVVFRFHRANHHLDGERAPHGWKRLTCKLRARNGPATRDRTRPIWIVVQAGRTIDPTTPLRPIRSHSSRRIRRTMVILATRRLTLFSAAKSRLGLKRLDSIRSLCYHPDSRGNGSLRRVRL